LVLIAITFVVAVLTLLAALLPTRTLRTTLVLIARHVSIPALLVSLLRLSHWFLLGPLRGRPARSKLDAELITRFSLTAPLPAILCCWGDAHVHLIRRHSRPDGGQLVAMRAIAVGRW